VNTCLKSGCFYNFTATLTISSSNSLDLDITYSGEPSLNQKMEFKEFYLFFDDTRIIFEDIVKISGPTHISIPVPDKLNLQVQWSNLYVII
jgi:hypothetical protein